MAKNKKADRNTKIENLSGDFKVLNCPKESINSYDISVDFEWGSELSTGINTAQQMKFFIKDFFSKCDQIRSFLRCSDYDSSVTKFSS